MTTVADLRAKRKSTFDQLDTLSKAADGRALTTDESATWNSLEKSIGDLDSQIERTEKLEKARGISAQPATATIPGTPAILVKADMGTPKPGHMAARFVRNLCKSKLVYGSAHPDNMLKMASADYGADDDLSKALTSASFADGGALIPEQFSSDFIELLRPQVAVRALAPRHYDLTGGNLTISGLSGGSSAYYIGEAADATKSQITLKQVKLNAKKLASLVPISNDLIRRTTGRGVAGADQTVLDDMLKQMARREDLAFIRGAGSDASPKGLLYFAPAANKFSNTQAGSTATVTETILDLEKLIGKLEDANVAMDSLGFIMHPKVKRFLMSLTFTNGVYAFRDELLRGTLYGAPFKCTTQIPQNVGTGAQSEVYLANFNDVILADELSPRVDISQEASFIDSGVAVSAFSQDLTVIRQITEHDLNVRHPESVAVLTTSWGA